MERTYLPCHCTFGHGISKLERFVDLRKYFFWRYFIILVACEPLSYIDDISANLVVNFGIPLMPLSKLFDEACLDNRSAAQT